MKQYPNRNVINIKSPKNETECVRIYKRLVPKANRPDGKDVSHVVTVNDERGYVLLAEDKNRSKDRNVHRGESFVSEKEIKENMKK